MNASRSTFVMCLLFILYFGNGIAQKVNYTTNSGIILGIGAGETHQNSDIPNSEGFAFDLTLGSHIIKKENAWLSADWKFRFLTGENVAFDHMINADNTYSNILYSFNSYDLELGVTLNRLKERTRIIVTGFAGAGLTSGQTFTDLYDSGNNPYDFSGIDPNRDKQAIYDDLVVLSDGDFESELTSGNAFLPTAGFFLGYQISKALSLGFEFKTNFYLSEGNSGTGINLDNRILTGSAKDRNSYINLSLYWALKHGSINTGGGPSSMNTPVTSNITNNNQVATNLPGPSVNITQPGDEVTSTSISNQTIKATIYNVADPDNVRFFQNGYPNNGFVFNPTTKNFTASVRLRDGENNFRIKATNRVSSAEDRVQIILEKPGEETQPAPFLSFTSPNKSNVSLDAEVVNLSATVKNISRKEDIQLTLNGKTIPFQYDPMAGLVTSTTSVPQGETRFRIIGRNDAGTAEDQISVNYNVPEEIALPEIKFINPPAPVSVQNMRFPLEAEIQYVGNRNDIAILRNGEQTGYFSLRPNGVISLMVNLAEGANTIDITATNAAGSVTNSTSIFYEKPAEKVFPPEIDIYYPAKSTIRTNRPTEELLASIRNISFKEQLKVYLNGSEKRDFNFNNTTQELRLNIPLLEGNNIVSLEARNVGGSVLKEQVYIYTPQVIIVPCDLPTVTFFIEKAGISGATHILKGTVANVKSRTGISVTLDGRPFNEFEYFPSTGIISAKFQLTPGSHRVIATVRNECGDNRYARGIDIEEPCIPPDIQFNVVSLSTPGATHVLQGKTSHVENKAYVSMTVDGASFDGFQFMPASGTLRARFNFAPGDHKIVTTVQNECGNASKTESVTIEQEEEVVVEDAKVDILEDVVSDDVQEETTEEVIVEEEEDPCIPPTVSINIQETDNQDATHVLSGTATNIKNKSEIKMTLDGKAYNGFQFVAATGVLSAKFKLEPGTHSVVATVQNECGTDSKTVDVIIEEDVVEEDVEETSEDVVDEIEEVIVEEEEDPCIPPTVSINIQETDNQDATHVLSGTATNIKNKSEIKMTLDGKAYNGFQFVAATGVLSAKFKLEPGTHSVVATVQNECGTDSKTVDVLIEEDVVEEDVEETSEDVVDEIEEVIVEEEEDPCIPPTVSINIQETDNQDATHVLSGTATNIKNKSEIKMTLDGKAYNGFQFVAATGVLSAKFKLEPGTHSVVATVQNECGTDSKTVDVLIEEDVVEEDVEDATEDLGSGDVQEETTEEVIVTEEQEEAPCGVRINPGNSSWQFCLVTPAGTYTRDNLQDKDFNYSGSATSLFFMPIGGDKEVTVNGSPYQLKSGQYYLFSGNIKVTVSTNNAGSMGQWSVCITADKAPVSGNGKNRPGSPCETIVNDNRGGKKGNK